MRYRSSNVCPFYRTITGLICGSLVTLVSTPNLSSAQDSPDSVVVDPTAALEIGAPLPEFDLPDAGGQRFKSEQFLNKPLVIFFFGTECPLVKLYVADLPKLARNENFKELQWIGINANQHDSLAEIQQFSKSNQLDGLPIPLLKDPGNVVADRFAAQRTPEVFLFDANHRLQYRGAIDDRYHYGQQKPQPDHQYLLDAIKSVLNDESVAVSKTDAIGCLIGRRLNANEASPVTYSNQISRILQRRCLNCHREGEVAPFSLHDYDEVVGWAEMIQEVTAQRRMPPWHANPQHGAFKNDASLTDLELEQIQQWVAAGAPAGNPADLPAPLEFATGWQIGQPDVVIPMTKEPYQVPATGVIEYQYFVVDPGFTEDKWIQAAECRIGNHAVVHHIIVAIHDEEQQPAHGQVESEWITATAPGSPPLILPTGYAKLVPAGSKLLFQMHYTPNGTAQTDISSVGFKFIDRAQVKRVVGTREIANTKFRIPPGADNHEVKAEFRISKNALILSLFPHMHLRGKSFRYTANYPDGKSEILLDVPQFDFNWQNGYEFSEPKLMPAGTVIQCVAHFDNSEDNFANPNPNKTVRWGDQTWDEMMIGYINMALADQDLTVTNDDDSN